LDKPLIGYVPDLKLSDEKLRGSITMWDILCHRTGLADADHLWNSGEYSEKEIYNRLYELKVKYPFREKFE